MASIRITRFWCFFCTLQRTERSDSEQFRTIQNKLEQATSKTILLSIISPTFASSEGQNGLTTAIFDLLIHQTNNDVRTCVPYITIYSLKLSINLS